MILSALETIFRYMLALPIMIFNCVIAIPCMIFGLFFEFLIFIKNMIKGSLNGYFMCLQEVNSGKFNGFKAYVVRNKITNLDLSYAYRSKDLGYLAEAIKDTDITDIDLSNNKINSDLEMFSNALKDTNITDIILSHNGIDNTSAHAFLRSLNGSKVTSVDLSYNLISDDLESFSDTLKNTNITSFYLNNYDDDENEDDGDGTISIKW